MLSPAWTAVLVGALLWFGQVAGVPRSAAEETAVRQPVEVPLGSDGVQRATIRMDSYSYDPQHLIVQAGKPIELTLTSVTLLTPHNFVLKVPELGLDIDETVWGGKTAVVRFAVPQPGTYPFYCDKKLLFFPSHREEGMEGTLEVR